MPIPTRRDDDGRGGWRWPKRISYLLLALLLAIAAGCLDQRTWTENSSGTRQDSPRQELPILLAETGYIAGEWVVERGGEAQRVQSIELVILYGPRRGDTVLVEHTVLASAGQQPLAPGDWVYVQQTYGTGSHDQYYIIGYARWPRLMVLALAFCALVLVVGRGRGARALAGMAFSFVILFLFLLPRLARGEPPVSTALIGAILTLPVSYLMAHGVNRKTLIALVGSAIGLGLTAVLAVGATWLSRLSGLASEEASFLQAMGSNTVDVHGLLLAGVIVGILGVLDDVTVTQAGIVEQIHELDAGLGWRELYARAMRLGQDHIASMVNTLVLVYAGSALPLLLLFSDRSLSPLYVLSHEVVAEEVTRMLVTSAGLVATVPLTTAIAAIVVRWWQRTFGDLSAASEPS